MRVRRRTMGLILAVLMAAFGAIAVVGYLIAPDQVTKRIVATTIFVGHVVIGFIIGLFWIFSSNNPEMDVPLTDGNVGNTVASVIAILLIGITLAWFLLTGTIFGWVPGGEEF